MFTSIRRLADSSAADTGAAVSARSERRSLAAVGEDLFELTKPRLSLLSVITAVVGYLTAGPEQAALGTLLVLTIGTSLAAGGAGVLNMWMERDLDARMARTRSRPIPAGRITAEAALAMGVVLSVGGVALLWFGVNAVAALLAVATLATYLLAYTPLKTRSPWCTHVGSIPGALPPLIGAAAIDGTIGPLGWVLFGILFAWQIPHFMAIAWSHRHDYAKAGMPMFTVVEPSGRLAAWHALVFCAILLGVSLVPLFTGTGGWLYGIVAVGTGIWFLAKSVRFLHPEGRTQTARKMFLASIVYLPVVLVALVVDRWLF